MKNSMKRALTGSNSLGNRILTIEKVLHYNVPMFIMKKGNAMTKTVPVPGKAKRVGEGGRPMRVKEWGISLLSSQNQRQPVVLDGVSPLSERI